MKRKPSSLRTHESTYSPPPLDDLPSSAWADYLKGLEILVTPEGQKLQHAMTRYAHRQWERVNTLPWADYPDITVATMAALSGAFLMPIMAMQQPEPFLAVYLGALAQQGGIRGIKKDLFICVAILRAYGEFLARVSKHPVGALLMIAADADDVPPQVLQRSRSMADRASAQWIKRAARGLSLDIHTPRPNERIGERISHRTIRSRQKTKDLAWLHGVLGEYDPSVVKEEAHGLLGQRLAEELSRLRILPFPELAAKAMSGALDFHLRSAPQAVLRGQRSEHERHQGLRIPSERDADNQEEREPEDPVAHTRIEAAAEDYGRFAAAVAKKFRLTKAGEQVIKQYLDYPGRTQAEIAALARVSLKTVKDTLKRIQEEPAKLREFLPGYKLPEKSR